MITFYTLLPDFSSASLSSSTEFVVWNHNICDVIFVANAMIPLKTIINTLWRVLCASKNFLWLSNIVKVKKRFHNGIFREEIQSDCGKMFINSAEVRRVFKYRWSCYQTWYKSKNHKKIQGAIDIYSWIERKSQVSVSEATGIFVWRYGSPIIRMVLSKVSVYQILRSVKNGSSILNPDTEYVKYPNMKRELILMN